MENLPFDVYAAGDGELAVQFMDRAESNPDSPCPHLLLLDLNLPKIDGFEVLRWVRASERWSMLPVLIVSSSDSPKDRAEAARLGAGYFRKPMAYLEFSKIGGVLRQLLEISGLSGPGS